MTSRNWTEDAACARADGESWFPDTGQSNTRAKAICGTCLAKEACLAWALEHNIQYGIWGGTSREDRQKLNRETAA